MVRILFSDDLLTKKDFSSFFYDGYYPDFKTFIRSTFYGNKPTNTLTIWFDESKPERFEYDTVHVEEVYGIGILMLIFMKQEDKSVPYVCVGQIIKTNRLLNLHFRKDSNGDDSIKYQIDNKPYQKDIVLSLPTNYDIITLKEDSIIYRQAKKKEDQSKKSAFFSDDIEYPFKAVATAQLRNAGDDTAGIYKYKLKRDINLIYFNKSWRCDVYVKEKKDIEASAEKLKKFFSPWGVEQVYFNGGGLENCVGNNTLENDLLAACVKAGVDGFKAAVMEDQHNNTKEYNFKNKFK